MKLRLPALPRAILLCMSWFGYEDYQGFVECNTAFAVVKYAHCSIDEICLHGYGDELARRHSGMSTEVSHIEPLLKARVIHKGRIFTNKSCMFHKRSCVLLESENL